MNRRLGASVSIEVKAAFMHVFQILGVLFIVAWLVAWLALKITFAAIHALVVIGVVLLILGFVVSR